MGWAEAADASGRVHYWNYDPKTGLTPGNSAPTTASTKASESSNPFSQQLAAADGAAARLEKLPKLKVYEDQDPFSLWDLLGNKVPTAEGWVSCARSFACRSRAAR